MTTTTPQLNYMDGPVDSPPTEAELRAFVGPNADYYLGKWGKPLHQGGGPAGFNWAACLLSGFWLPFRKMYRVALIFFAVTFAIGLLEELFFGVYLGKETPKALDRATSFAAALVCGMFGNQWYLSHARRVIRRSRAEHPDESIRLQVLAKRGGRSVWISIGFVVLAFAVMIGLLMALDVAMNL